MKCPITLQVTSAWLRPRSKERLQVIGKCWIMNRADSRTSRPVTFKDRGAAERDRQMKHRAANSSATADEHVANHEDRRIDIRRVVGQADLAENFREPFALRIRVRGGRPLAAKDM